jgi:hypothetical protein
MVEYSLESGGIQDMASSDTTNEDIQGLQATIVEGMAAFSAQNPEIIEAMAVMSIALPDYLQAVEAIRGGQTTSASSVVGPTPLVQLAF